MKHTKKILALLLVTVLLLSACGTTKPSSTGSTGDTSTPASTENGGSTPDTEGDSNVTPAGTFPIVNEQIELTVAVAEPSDAAEDYATNLFTLALEEKTNIKLKWDYVNASAFIENVNMMFASGSLPDLLVSGVAAATRLDKSRESQLATQGMILPLDELFEEYAPNISNALVVQDGLRTFAQQPDGKIYSVPTVENAYHSLWSAKYWINDTWLNNLDLEYPTTPDELYNVLVAFRDNDPNQNGLKDEIPFSTVKAGNMVALDVFLMNPFTYSPGPDRLYLEDGKVVFTPTEEGFADGLAYLNKLYSEGLIYVDSFSQETKDQVAMNENGEDAVLGSWISQHLGYGCDLNVSDKWQQYQSLPPLKGSNPLSPISTYSPYNKYITGHVAITKDCENPAAAVRMIDYFYTDEGIMAALVGREGTEWQAAGPDQVGLDGQPAQWVRNNIDNSDPAFKNVKWGQMFATYRDTEYYKSEAYPSDPYADDVNPMTGRMVIFQNASKDHEAVSQKLENCLPNLSYGEDVAAEAVQLKTTIDQYVNEMVAAFTTGSKSVESDFESFINELNKMGLARYLEIVQQTYDELYA